MAGLVPAISLNGTLMPSYIDSRAKRGHHAWDSESPLPNIGMSRYQDDMVSDPMSVPLIGLSDYHWICSANPPDTVQVNS